MTSRTLVAAFATLLTIGLVLMGTACKKEPAPQTTPECEPEGGIKCEGDRLELCTKGVLVNAGECPGGCKTAGREARCFDASKSLIAPEGTACQPGMALCSMTPNTLLVCRDGTLQKAADCPRGCLDRGDGSMIYCLDDTEHVRFAKGIGCTGLGDQFRLACAADGRSVLQCSKEYYTLYSTQCHTCKQGRNGSLACLNEVGDRIDVTPDNVVPATPE